MRKVLLFLFIAICLMAFGLGGYMLFQQGGEYTKGEDVYSDLADFVEISVSEKTPAPTPKESEAVEEPSKWADVAWPEVDFTSLKEINPDIVAWLYCENTVINYPVVQTDDNSFYLKHLFDGQYNTSGCLFLDCRNDNGFSDLHSIIYGHHLQSGKMFASLDGYKKQEYYEEHPVLLLITPDKKYVIELFAGYVASVSDNAWDVGFSPTGEFERWFTAAKEKSCFESAAIPFPESHIITLSTCSYEFNDARFVVLGVIEEA